MSHLSTKAHEVARLLQRACFTEAEYTPDWDELLEAVKGDLEDGAPVMDIYEARIFVDDPDEAVDLREAYPRTDLYLEENMA